MEILVIDIKVHQFILMALVVVAGTAAAVLDTIMVVRILDILVAVEAQVMFIQNLLLQIIQKVAF